MIWVALALSACGLFIWVGVGLLAVSAWRRWKPTVAAYAKMFQPPEQR